MNSSKFLALVTAFSFALGCNPPTATPQPQRIDPTPISNSDNRKIQEIIDSNGTKLYFKQVEVKYHPPAPTYPPEIKALGIQGTVKVMVIVGADGIPVKATAESGPRELHKISEEYALAWRFLPAELNGVAQSARFIINLPFKLVE